MLHRAHVQKGIDGGSGEAPRSPHFDGRERMRRSERVDVFWFTSELLGQILCTEDVNDLGGAIRGTPSWQ